MFSRNKINESVNLRPLWSSSDVRATATVGPPSGSSGTRGPHRGDGMPPGGGERPAVSGDDLGAPRMSLIEKGVIRCRLSPPWSPRVAAGPSLRLGTPTAPASDEAADAEVDGVGNGGGGEGGSSTRWRSAVEPALPGGSRSSAGIASPIAAGASSRLTRSDSRACNRHDHPLPPPRPPPPPRNIHVLRYRPARMRRRACSRP